MTSITILNKLARFRYIRIDDLEIGEKYPIKKFDIYVDTQFNKGNCVRVILEDDGYIILPQRFNELLEGDQLAKMNAEKLAVVYHGKNKNTIDISFEVISDSETLTTTETLSDSESLSTTETSST